MLVASCRGRFASGLAAQTRDVRFEGFLLDTNSRQICVILGLAPTQTRGDARFQMILLGANGSQLVRERGAECRHILPQTLDSLGKPFDAIFLVASFVDARTASRP
jgi:hypothetical protein